MFLKQTKTPTTHTPIHRNCGIIEAKSDKWTFACVKTTNCICTIIHTFSIFVNLLLTCACTHLAGIIGESRLKGGANTDIFHWRLERLPTVCLCSLFYRVFALWFALLLPVGRLAKKHTQTRLKPYAQEAQVSDLMGIWWSSSTRRENREKRETRLRERTKERIVTVLHIHHKPQARARARDSPLNSSTVPFLVHQATVDFRNEVGGMGVVFSQRIKTSVISVWDLPFVDFVRRAINIYHCNENCCPVVPQIK